VIVSDLKGTSNYDLAVEHGFKPLAADELAKKADIIHILIPDEHQGGMYKRDIARR